MLGKIIGPNMSFIELYYWSKNCTFSPLSFRKLQFWPLCFKIAFLLPYLYSILQKVNFDQVNDDVASHLSDSAATSALIFPFNNFLKKK
jgi:hypothetical protein